MKAIIITDMPIKKPKPLIHITVLRAVYFKKNAKFSVSMAHIYKTWVWVWVGGRVNAHDGLSGPTITTATKKHLHVALSIIRLSLSMMLCSIACVYEILLVMILGFVVMIKFLYHNEATL